MASAPQSNSLPIFYNNLEPLSSQTHAKFKARMVDKAPFLSKNHAVPLTVDEFAMAQRHFPIVFSAGNDPVPLALMGLNEGVNVFVDDEGKLTDPVYVPAYIRRYPFLLAKLRPDNDELSLCFDPTADAVGEFDEGAGAVRGWQAERGDPGNPALRRTVRTGGPAHRPVHEGTGRFGPADRRRSRDPAQ